MNMCQMWWMLFQAGPAGAGLLKHEPWNIKQKPPRTHPHVQILPGDFKPIGFTKHSQVLDAGISLLDTEAACSVMELENY